MTDGDDDDWDLKDPDPTNPEDLRTYAAHLRAYLSTEEAKTRGHTLDADVLSTPPVPRLKHNDRRFGGSFIGLVIDRLVKLGFLAREWTRSATARLTFAELLEYINRMLIGSAPRSA